MMHRISEEVVPHVHTPFLEEGRFSDHDEDSALMGYQSGEDVQPDFEGQEYVLRTPSPTPDDLSVKRRNSVTSAYMTNLPDRELLEAQLFHLMI